MQKIWNSKELEEKISEALDSTLNGIYAGLGITAGDIAPAQALIWDGICRDAAELFEQLIEQNTPHEK